MRNMRHLAHTAFGLVSVLCFALSPTRSDALTSFGIETTTPDTLIDIKFQADFTIAGNTLTLVLTNDSLNHSGGPSPTMNPNDLLTSFYFDIWNGVTRPTLTYTGAAGDVCKGIKIGADDCTVTQQPGDGSSETDLRAFVVGDDGWQAKSGLTLSPGSETLTFGIGTAGNNSLTPNGFNGNIVDGMDYGIYAGDVSTNNLNGQYLVSTTATFTFSGLTGYTEADIRPEVLFGLGTQPDSTAFVPEPTTGLLMVTGLAGLLWSGRSRRSA